MRVLFSFFGPGWLRNFESVLRLLGEQGHEVHVAFHGGRHVAGTQSLVEKLARDVPSLTFEEAPSFKDPWLRLSDDLRTSMNLLHFHDDRFPPVYRARSLHRRDRMRGRVSALVDATVVRRSFARHALFSALDAAQRAVPAHEGIERYIAALTPDVVLFTPYLGVSHIQPSYLRAARALGLPTAACVFSWDNLTSKSLMSPLPDAVFVWNETQRQEATELHQVPEDRVIVTGAQCFDEWLAWQPRPRVEFCQRVGIDPGRPFVLYVTFTPLRHAEHRDEVGFVRGWIEGIRRSSDPTLAEASIVVRPHPKRGEDWQEADLTAYPGVVVWPPKAQFPTDVESKADYFDSIHHSACVVGINSTAMLEAGLIGRPVLTILSPEFWESQQGTLHFRYMLEVGGGLLRVARSLDEHLTHLSETVAGRDTEAAARSRRFAEAFIRPYGLDRPATPVFVDAVARLAAEGARPVGTRVRDAIVRPVLATAIALGGMPSRLQHEVRRVVCKLRRLGRHTRRIG